MSIKLPVGTECMVGITKESKGSLFMDIRKQKEQILGGISDAADNENLVLSNWSLFALLTHRSL